MLNFHIYTFTMDISGGQGGYSGGGGSSGGGYSGGGGGGQSYQTGMNECW